MFKLIGILLLILYFGYLAQEYALMKKRINKEEIVYRYRPIMATTNLGNESFLRTHYDMFQKNPILFGGEYTTELLDSINDNLLETNEI